MAGALDGVRVLEVSQIIAGPMCGVFLSDMGADVVKIESAAGDGMRLLGQIAPGESKGFHVFNRGKRGIVLDLASDDGQAVARRLVRGFDVFLINARPGVPARLGLDYETLRAERPDLIYLDNTAYGPEGPSAHRAGADIIAQAYSGLMAGDEKFDEHGGPDLITATTPADFSAAYSSAIAVCAALFHRERTGEGQRIQTSLLASALTLQNAFVARMPVSDAVLLDPMLAALAEARERGASWRELQASRGGLRALVGGAFLLYYGGYQTSDGAIMLGCVTPHNQQQVRDAVGLEHDPTTDPDFNPLAEESKAIVAGVRAQISERFAGNTTEYWIARLDEAGAPGVAGESAGGHDRRPPGGGAGPDGGAGTCADRSGDDGRPVVVDVGDSVGSPGRVARAGRRHGRGAGRARLQRRRDRRPPRRRCHRRPAGR